MLMVERVRSDIYSSTRRSSTPSASTNVAGIGVLVEAEGVDERLVDEYMSLLTLSTINMKEKSIEIQNGNFLRFFKDNLLKNGETES